MKCPVSGNMFCALFWPFLCSEPFYGRFHLLRGKVVVSKKMRPVVADIFVISQKIRILGKLKGHFCGFSEVLLQKSNRGIVTI